MTNEELAEILRAYVAQRQAARARGEHIDSDERREAALLALDEARAALPVLRTCAPCRHWHRPRTFYGYEAARCEKVSPPMPIDVDAPPPTTCPLRGGAR